MSQLGLVQEAITKRGFAIQCRVTTEDPAHAFQPDTADPQTLFPPCFSFHATLEGSAGRLAAPYIGTTALCQTPSTVQIDATDNHREPSRAFDAARRDINYFGPRYAGAYAYGLELPRCWTQSPSGTACMYLGFDRVAIKVM